MKWLPLRDKANLALGYAWLQANNPAAARTALERVRLSGPYSTRALLGMGWAEAALGQYREALAPWTELHSRNLLDAAVQESYLAVPYAYGKLNANAQAAEFYESAIKSFDSEAQQIDTAVASIGAGHMTDDLLGADPQSDQQGWFWQLKQLPDAPQSRYLYSLLADNDFQEGLKNYRDLGYLAGTLKGWDDSMDAFRAMIDTRERAHAERLPRVDALAGEQCAGKTAGGARRGRFAPDRDRDRRGRCRAGFAGGTGAMGQGTGARGRAAPMPPAWMRTNCRPSATSSG